MHYSQFIRFTTELHSQGISTLFLSGFTIKAFRKNSYWIVKAKILVADSQECARLLDVVPIGEKIRLERARASLDCSDGALILSAEIPITSRFLAARHALENYVMLARFWQEELSPLTLLAGEW